MRDSWSKYGSTTFTAPIIEMGDAPAKNWSAAGSKEFPMKTKSNNIGGEALRKFVKKNYYCNACPVGCGAIVDLEDDKYRIKDGHRPEYETSAAFGSMTLNDDIKSIIKSNDICNRYGVDTISAGATIAFAIECYEAGILTTEETGGIELTWGNDEAIVQILEKLVKREDFGEVLADGVKKAAERIGKDSEKYAMHVHGQEVPMHDPRLNPSYGTTYVTDPTPARHTQGGAALQEAGSPHIILEGIDLPRLKKYDYSGKGELHALLSNINQTAYGLGLCYYTGMFAAYPLEEVINSVTGWNLTQEDFILAGERIQNLRQLFNVREGIKPSDFNLPERIRGNPPLPSGPLAGKTIDIDTLRKEYFDAMDWNIHTGKPSEARLQKLELMDYLENLQ
ncbi:MAG: aldehyde ferredoxin oxidoreductase C-terminal domain-containing protein [Candidatus Kariarchaeaceae archaeon]|jgi:aldehyde:ferredoxin oxidoreductase